MFGHVLAQLIRFFAHRRGNVALTFALSSVPVMGLVGAGVDYAVANKWRTKLQAAADSAAVGSVAKKAVGYQAAVAMASDGTVPAGAADAADIFNAVIENDTGFTKPTLDITYKRQNGQVVASVSYQSSVKTLFMGMLGKTSVALAGTSEAASALPTYIDFHLLLDNSPSMGVGARISDIDTMVANTPDKCAFACHDKSDPTNYYKLAKNLNVKMRIDVVRQATQQLMDYATTVQAVPGQFRAAIYTFGADATDAGLATIQSLTTDLSKAKVAADKIDLMTVPYQNYKGDTLTDFNDILKEADSKLPKSGSGISSSKSIKYLFFVTDGINDRVVGSSSCAKSTTVSSDPQTRLNFTRCQEPLPTSLCTTLKNRGIRIAVLYTTYLPLPTNDWYKTWIQPWQSEIAPKMQACASPELYFEVSPSQGIPEAMIALFEKALKTAHITK